MKKQVHRKAHTRRLPDGRVVPVRESAYEMSVGERVGQALSWAVRRGGPLLARGLRTTGKGLVWTHRTHPRAAAGAVVGLGAGLALAGLVAPIVLLPAGAYAVERCLTWRRRRPATRTVVPTPTTSATRAHPLRGRRRGTGTATRQDIGWSASEVVAFHESPTGPGKTGIEVELPNGDSLVLSPEAAEDFQMRREARTRLVDGARHMPSHAEQVEDLLAVIALHNITHPHSRRQ